MELDITITKSTLIEWIQLYYKKFKSMDVEVEFQTELTRDRRDEYWVTTANIQTELELLGKKYPVTESISKKEIEDIACVVLAETDYKLGYFCFDMLDSENHREMKGAKLKIQRKDLIKSASLQRHL